MKCDELKAFDVELGQYCEDGSPCVVAFDADRNPRLLNEKVYLKSEADKVIMDITKGAISMFREPSCCRGFDLKSPIGKIADAAYKHWMRDSITENENKRLKEEKDQLSYNNSQFIDRTFRLEKHVISQDREIRNQKYKRCLDKAKYWVAVFYQSVDDRHRRSAEKHHYKWLEIAEKFKDKEAK